MKNAFLLICLLLRQLSISGVQANNNVNKRQSKSSSISYNFNASQNYFIRAKCSNRFLDIHLPNAHSSQITDYTPISLWPKRCGKWQWFRIEHLKTDKYFIYPSSTPKMLITSTLSSNSQGEFRSSFGGGGGSRGVSPIKKFSAYLQTRFNGRNQQWKLIPHSDGSWSFKNVASKQCLEVGNSNYLKLSCCEDGSALQSFYILKAAKPTNSQ